LAIPSPSFFCRLRNPCTNFVRANSLDYKSQHPHRSSNTRTRREQGNRCQHHQHCHHDNCFFSISVVISITQQETSRAIQNYYWEENLLVLFSLPLLLLPLWFSSTGPRQRQCSRPHPYLLGRTLCLGIRNVHHHLVRTRTSHSRLGPSRTH